MSGSQLITWPMPLMSCEISTFTTPPPPHHTIQVAYDEEDPLRRGVMSEYDPAYQTPHFSNASPMHLRSSSAYSDALHIGLCMLHNSTPPPASAPLHMPPLLVCLFVCLPLSLVHVLLVCLFVSPSGLFPLIDVQWTSAKSDCTCSIRRGLGRRLRSSLLLNSSPRCNPPCRIVY